MGYQNLAVDAKNLALYAVKVMKVDWIRLITEHLLLTLELNMDELNKIKACVRVRFSITRTHEIELHDLNRDELTDSLSTLTAELKGQFTRRMIDFHLKEYGSGVG